MWRDASVIVLLLGPFSLAAATVIYRACRRNLRRTPETHPYVRTSFTLLWASTAAALAVGVSVTERITSEDPAVKFISTAALMISAAGIWLGFTGLLSWGLGNATVALISAGRWALVMDNWKVAYRSSIQTAKGLVAFTVLIAVAGAVLFGGILALILGWSALQGLSVHALLVVIVLLLLFK